MRSPRQHFDYTNNCFRFGPRLQNLRDKANKGRPNTSGSTFQFGIQKGRAEEEMNYLGCKVGMTLFNKMKECVKCNNDSGGGGGGYWRFAKNTLTPETENADYLGCPGEKQAFDLGRITNANDMFSLTCKSCFGVPWVAQNFLYNSGFCVNELSNWKTRRVKP